MRGGQLAALGGFAIALVLSAVATPAADLLGRRLRLVRHPVPPGGRQQRSVSYAPGAALGLAALAGLAIAHGLSGPAGGVVVGGVLLFWLGMVDDRARRGPVPGWKWLAVEGIVALLAWGAGAGVHGIASGLAGLALSVIVLVAVANAFTALDTCGGVAAATGAGCAAGLLALGFLVHQELAATLAATALGASLGFLGPTSGRRRMHLGSGGSLLLGFLLAVTALRLRLPTAPITGLVAVLACLVVPLCEAGATLGWRFLAGRPLWRPGADHLAHRLRRLGLHRRGVIAIHAGCALAGGAAAVLSVRAPTPLPGVVLLAGCAAGAGALGFVGVRGRRRLRPARVGLAAVVLTGLVLLAVAGATALAASSRLKAAHADLVRAQSALKGLKLPAAGAALDAAAPQLRRAEDLLSSPLTLAGRIVPGVRNNFAVSLALTRSGSDLVAAGRQGVAVLASVAHGSGRLDLPIHNGVVDLTSFQKAATPAAALRADVARAQQAVDGSPAGFLVGPVRTARASAVGELANARRLAEEARAATVLIPAAFGAGGQQTWVVGAEDNAEQRGRGGYLGSIGVVTATAGQLALGQFTGNQALPGLPAATAAGDLPAEYAATYDRLGALAAWQNLTMSPSFASGGQVLLGMLQRVTGLQATWLVGIDPTGLANLLAVTGPVSVPGIPVPLSSANVVDWALNQLYFAYPSTTQRHDVLSGVAHAVFERILAGSYDPRALAGALAKSIAGDDLTVYSTVPGLEAMLSQVGVGGTVARGPGDYLLVDGQNQSENKMDYYLHRAIDYRADLARDGSEQVVLTVAEHSSAPAGVALPDVVGGARPDLGLAAGVDRTYLGALVPANAVLEGVSVNGATAPDVFDGAQLGKRLLATYVEVPQGGSATLQIRYDVPGVLGPDGYQLTVQNQAMVQPDSLTVHVQLPAGYQISRAQGLADAGGGLLAWSGRLTSSRHLSVSATPTLLAQVASHL
ncbi:MAG TPA: DUF4012 domain-containing protein [Actinomycetota bacterium]|nr:DUF4012 domain-containing protein [Actinomycetota bacterium]